MFYFAGIFRFVFLNIYYYFVIYTYSIFLFKLNFRIHLLKAVYNKQIQYSRHCNESQIKINVKLNKTKKIPYPVICVCLFSVVESRFNTVEHRLT